MSVSVVSITATNELFEALIYCCNGSTEAAVALSVKVAAEMPGSYVIETVLEAVLPDLSYKIQDQNYKTPEQLIQYIVKAAGMNANLLMNLGPQPNGELPATGVERLKKVGEWMSQYGETIYGTRGGDIPPHDWGVTTRKGNKLFIHILNLKDKALYIPVTAKVKSVAKFIDKKALTFKQDKEGILIYLPEVPSGPDYVVELTMK